MTIHDWTRVPPGIFHNFHLMWIAELNSVLNSGLLPPDYYALAEQAIGGITPDILTLHESSTPPHVDHPPEFAGNVSSVAVAPPQLDISLELDDTVYVAKQNRLTIHHVSDDRVVALLEIISSGNKNSSFELDRLVQKTIGAIAAGCNVSLIDLYPPTRRDPQGIHGAIWAELGDSSYIAPDRKPLTLAAHVADFPRRAYVQPLAVGDALRDLPIFLDPSHYVNVPLEATYLTAFGHLPLRWTNELQLPR